ncbi:F0F1 ATP synthase subunit alpha [Candidatus Cytomitobacter indipagum]|uniref:ATP synthase subunit alpha n=1 Tax=Candidatus Cytomitobacter indipagum TaxID=2601575 RepID=A0A5C0UEK5_9PROT|nr:F0F1 ATP synthase subunit alpha [Candidatus Cytomitobacter indipagum]QEK38130.1 F0F1 ATP synthase subunit alpha [Candidatus Cytomitobacter indipagum]
MNRLNFEDIVNGIKSKIDSMNTNIDIYETGKVETASDGICNILGLSDAIYGEVVIFENKQKGLIVELLEDSAKIAILDSNPSVKSGMMVYRTKKILSVKVGPEMLGRTVNAFGEPIDGKGEIETSLERVVMSESPQIIDRKKVTQPLYTGVKMIDALIPIGYGQRELILGDRRTGKTTIAIGTILNQKKHYEEGNPIYCVYVCIGKKASEAAKLVHYLEEQGAMNYSTFVVASADDPAIFQHLAPYVGTAIAEYYRDNGKHALIIYDDLSKHAIAYREISLLLKRFPGREAYPGDIFFVHSSLLERAACMSDEKGGGSLTAIPIIETLEGDISSYISTNVISITDGQIFMDKNLFLYGQRPAINTNISVSRVGGSAQTQAMRKVSGMLKLELAQYAELKEFSRFLTDIDDTTKKALRRGEAVTKILRQGASQLYSFEDEVLVIFACNAGYFDHFNPDHLEEVEKNFLLKFKKEHPEIVEKLITNKVINDEIDNTIKRFIKKSKEQS